MGVWSPPSQSPPRMGGEAGSLPRDGGSADCPHCGAFLIAPPLWGGYGGAAGVGGRSPPLNLPPGWGERPNCPPIVGGYGGAACEGGGAPLSISPQDGGRGQTAPPSWGATGGLRARAAEPPSQSPPATGGEAKLPPQDGGRGQIVPPLWGAFLIAPPSWGGYGGGGRGNRGGRGFRPRPPVWCGLDAGVRLAGEPEH